MNKRNVIWTWFVLLIGFVALNFATPNNTVASTPIERPVPTADDGINQFYLYGGENVLTGAVHKGVDFTSNITLGDSVRAVADGTVVDLVEANANGCSPSGTPNCNDYGNYVLIRHDQRHYDATTALTSYVYSLYMHLRQNSVSVNVNDVVTAQQIIAQADDTGNSTGHHLHLQMILHDLSNRTLTSIDPENKTRNPELWLRQLGNTAKLAGRVSDSNGNPIPDLIIQGIQKDVGPVSLLTYDTASHPELKPDDLLFENFATTDISPGSYCLQVVNGDNLGCHSFVADWRL